ncbi:putative holin protein, partial [Escherichia coli 90.0039]
MAVSGRHWRLFVFLYFHFLSAVTETYIRWKKSQQVCHTP